MKSYRSIICYSALLILLASNCSSDNEEAAHTDEHPAEGPHEQAVHLSEAQFEALQMDIGKLAMRNLSDVVNANGQLEVPPQNEATVTAIIGANIATIEVIEGDDVRKGQVLAYISHPDLIEIQKDFVNAQLNHDLLLANYSRQEKLYNAGVASGKSYEQARAEFQTAEATMRSLASQLQQLGIPYTTLSADNLYTRVPVKSPINGTITRVEVKTGQYVQPMMDLFEIVNIEHIHTDLMVFERDVHKVEKGQQVRFTVETLPGQELSATIYSVGKEFEQNPKAVHVHAEIENKVGKLIPGMYIQGQILLDSMRTNALPKSAIIRDDDRYIAFLAEKIMHGDHGEWVFTPIEVQATDNGGDWIAVKFSEPLESNARFALNNAYYLIAELKKGEAGHHH